MPAYKYEIHTHTTEASKCSAISAVELVRFYKDLGYSGLCITDHFLNGNTSVPDDLFWEEQIELFCSGFENALFEGKRVGLKVFFGWEYSYRGMHLLTYGLDKQWLLDHPDLLQMEIGEYCELVREDGGLIIHAHPFREADFIDMIRLLPRQVDAVEVYNACRTDFENDRAFEYAEGYDLPQVAGSDNHKGQLDRLGGLQFPFQLEGVEDMVSAVHKEQMEMFISKASCSKPQII